jgi:hypothetical protein
MEQTGEPMSKYADPIITQQTVRDALESLLYNLKSKSPTPLTRLALVSQYITDANLPAMNHPEEYALQNVLVELIANAYTRRRTSLGLNNPDAHHTLSKALEAIHQDAQTGNHELLGWCWLYHHYVRFDLCLPAALFCQVACIDERTLRRYQSHALRRLTELLIREEQKARQTQRSQRLLSSLPSQVKTRLFGRLSCLFDLQQALEENPRQHLLITGEEGIGKTTFVQEVVRWQIETGKLIHLIWLEQPLSVFQVWREIEQRLSPAPLSLKEYLFVHPTALVLDEIGFLLEDDEKFETLLLDLNAATVYIVHPEYVPLPRLDLHIPLSPLNRNDAFAYIRLLVNTHYREDSPFVTEEELEAVWQHAGGHPASIQQTVHQYWGTANELSMITYSPRRKSQMTDNETIQRLTWQWKRVRNRVLDAVYTVEGLRGGYWPQNGIDEIRQIVEQLAPLDEARAEEIRKDILLLEGIVQRWQNIYWPG